MISVLVYGRNDAYGYGLQRRSALSLNALATRLDAPGDEIVFVDYNTDDALPTFPEAIADTLTDRARAALRVLRVRPAFHARVAPEAPRPVLEALARNIGLRRAQPGNRWVLSTNPDVLLLSEDGAEGGGSLSATAAALPDGHYGLPRFELPRLLWERLDRSAPEAAAEAVTGWAAALRLDEVVRHEDPAIGFDAPGDFQLALREDLLAIGGFDERMRLGWHVDANLAVRLGLRRGLVRRLPGFRLYHFEHTSGAAEGRRAGRSEDDPVRFVRDVVDPVADPAEGWGAPAAAVEEIALDTAPAASLPAALVRALGPGSARPDEGTYGPSSYDRTARAPERALVFLLDRLAHCAPTTVIGWIGPDALMLDLAVRALAAAGFAPPLVAAEAGPAERPDAVPAETVFDRADLFVFDAPDPAGARKTVEAAADAFGRLVAAERARLRAGAPARPIVGLHVVHNAFEGMFLTAVDATLAPFPTRLRHGVVRPPAPGFVSWLEAATPGPAGRRLAAGGAITAAPGVTGHVLHGPHARLAPGPRRLRLAFRVERPRLRTALRRALESGRGGGGSGLVIEAVLGPRYLAQRDLSPGEIEAGAAELAFMAPPEALRPAGPGVEARLWTSGALALTVVGLEVAEA